MKKLLVLQGPASSRSGYGDHTRDILKSLIAMDKFEIKVVDLRWEIALEMELAKMMNT